MSVLANSAVIGGDAVDTGDIGHSLRFRSGASTYLTESMGASGSQQVRTFNWNFKTAGVRASGWHVFFGSYLDINNWEAVALTDAGQLVYYCRKLNVDVTYVLSTSYFRDPTNHINFTMKADGSQAAGSRWLFYANGVLIPMTVTTDTSTSMLFGEVAYSNWIGRGYFAGTTSYADGYLSRLCFVDGTALTPSSFGYFNTTTNEWVSKSQSAVKAIVDAGGTNSFMLDFDDATSLTTLGYDKSSKGNNWTLNNFSLTAGTTYDHMLDVPGNSFATLNPLDKMTSTVNASDGNLKVNAGGPTYIQLIRATIANSTGKWYWEVTPTSNGPQLSIGVSNAATAVASSNAEFPNGWYYTGTTGSKRTNATSTAYGAAYTNNDVIGVALDLDSDSITFYKNGVSQGVAWSGVFAGKSIAPGLHDAANDVIGFINFGQAPLHASATYDSAAGGYFRYTPPTGFKALCQANIADVSPASLLDPTDHHADILVTKSGNTNFTIPWNASTYDTFFEIKSRNIAGDWYQIDGLRGYDKILKSNSIAAETTDANVLSVSGTTGTLGSTLADGTYVVSCTKAGLTASRQTNTDGSITSTVSRNVDSGFAIATYTGTGANATVGHGLGVACKTRFIKARTGAATEWAVYYGDGTKYLYLTSTAAAGTNSAFWNNTNDTSTTFSLGTINHTNGNTITYVAYCYADSAIQKSFSYTGNGSADGPYANLGFKCGTATIKSSTAADDWRRYDSLRPGYNVQGGTLLANTTAAETTVAEVDIVSNALKMRIATTPNAAQTYIGHAWAAVTGKYSLAR